MESAGLLLQMDGSSHRWFGNKKSCLIAIIDDATSEIHAEFLKSEITQGCLKVMRDYIEKRNFQYSVSNHPKTFITTPDMR